MSKFIDLTGQRFGRWTVRERASNEAKWLCRCECGTERMVEGKALRSGATKSCGCGRGGTPRITIDETIDADDKLTADADLRIRQLNLKLYSARVAAEKASAIHASAIRRMRAAELTFNRAVNERRSAAR